ncbi:hypothetical protein [Yeosuana marina]|uniref:hypothetical protein n=1 Tax=Yeosuana marina TaxID=1565536 RepID=UPI0030C8BB67
MKIKQFTTKKNSLKSTQINCVTFTSKFSVPNQYAAQVGTLYFFNVKGFNLYLEDRLEGVPASDLIGGSACYRRPGYVISLDSGINYSAPNLTLSLNAPIALERNTTQSYLDKQKTAQTEVFSQSDAGFADYLINFNITNRFKKKNKEVIPNSIVDFYKN